jgi:hypothetical protein
LSALSSCHLNPDNVVLIAGDTYRPTDHAPLGQVTGQQPGTGHIRVLAEAAGSYRLRVTSSKPTWLLVRQTWAPGWQASADGRLLRLDRADVAFMAVRLPAGSETLLLSYRPRAVKLGTFVSLGAIALILLLAGGSGFVSVVRRRGRTQRRTFATRAPT